MKENIDNSIINHYKEKQILIDAILSGRSHHSWLITGHIGIGKLNFIYDVVYDIFLKNDIDKEKSTHIKLQLDHNNYSNLLYIQKAKNKKNILIEDIRKIGHFLTLSASDNNCKIVIINNICDMNINSSNALLKILEEPPQNCYIFLINNSEHNVLKTIKSRCIILRLRFSGYNNFLELIKNSKFSSEDEMNKIIHISGNSPNLAIKLSGYDILKLYNNLLNILKNKFDIYIIYSFIDELISVTKEDSNMIIKILFNHIFVNIAKIIINLEITEIIDYESQLIYKISIVKKFEQWSNLYEKQRKLLLDQEQYNLDLKQIIFLIINYIVNQ